MEATLGKPGDEPVEREIHQQAAADGDGGLLQRKTLRDLVQRKVLREGSLGRGDMCKPSFVPAGSS